MRKTWVIILTVLVLLAFVAVPAGAATSTYQQCYYKWVWTAYGWRLARVCRPVTPPPQPSPPPVPNPTPGLTADESYIVQQVNAERARVGLGPLQIDQRLVQTARAKSRDMVVNGYFGHQSPTLGSPFDQMRNAGISYRYAGENIACYQTAAGAMQGWMNSSGHRANILSPSFTRIGVGVVDGGQCGKMLTQHFIG